MKVGITCDDMYPFFHVSSQDCEVADSVIDIDEQTFNRWKEAFENFGKVQHELAEKLNVCDFYGDEYDV